MTRHQFTLVMLVAFVVAVATGCGYRLAGGGSLETFLPEGTRTIGIPTLDNDTPQADIDKRISEALVEEFVRRSDIEVLPRAVGTDVVLEGTISNYREDPVTFTTQGRFSRLEVTITARMRLIRSSPEKVLWSQNHFVFREQYDVPESPVAEFESELVAIEEIADDFARSVVTSILEGF